MMRVLSSWVGPAEIPYRDPNGYRRLACLSDPMEAEGLFGLARLPRQVHHLIRPGDWTIDIGANVGLMAGDLCALVGMSGVVWAIEPVPRNVQRLRELREANGLRHLTIFEIALANRIGTATLRLPSRPGSGWASFTASWNTGDSLTVPVSTLDALAQESPPGKRLSFIKLDVEGAEPLILEGGVRTLTTHRPWVLCEFNEPVLQDAGTSSQVLLGRFKELGYQPAAQIRPIGYDVLLKAGS